MREHGMSVSGGIGMGTWDVLDGGDGDLVDCCDGCVGGVGGGDDNSGVGCDYGSGDGTDKCGADGAVVGFVEGSNVGMRKDISGGNQVNDMVSWFNTLFHCSSMYSVLIWGTIIFVNDRIP